MARATPAGSCSAAEPPGWGRAVRAGLRLPAAPAGGQSARAGRKCVRRRRRGRLVRRGRGEAAPVSAGAPGGPWGPAPPRPPPPRAPLTPPSSPRPSQPPRPGSAHSPLPPLLGLTAALLPPVPGGLAPHVPGRGSFAALGTALARPQRRLVVGLGPGRPWRLLAAPGPVGPARPFPGAARGPLCFSQPVPLSHSRRSPCSARPSRPRPLGSPLRWSVPEVPSRCPGLRVLLRRGRRCRGRRGCGRGPAPRGSAAITPRPGSRRGAQHRPAPGAAGRVRIGALSLPALRPACSGSLAELQAMWQKRRCSGSETRVKPESSFPCTDKGFFC